MSFIIDNIIRSRLIAINKQLEKRSENERRLTAFHHATYTPRTIHIQSCNESENVGFERRNANILVLNVTVTHVEKPPPPISQIKS